jgi:hypothetical protein
MPWDWKRILQLLNRLPQTSEVLTPTALSFTSKKLPPV